MYLGFMCVFICMYVSMCVQTCARRFPQNPEEDVVGALRAGVAGDCELPTVAAGSRTLISRNSESP